MFDFEGWSKQVYSLIDLIEQSEANSQEKETYEKELKLLWEELFQQKDDMFVQFLTQLLGVTKEVLDGKKDHFELEQLVDSMRENVLK